ncbi:bifunctional phosphopantothenoylcysteine decarboxylase/phosphopantothenate--cysteine ligase CoaBC [Candidatus Gottesmanbacteria bacterium]|nr:bifunctional phosphopantothenoylcysteine decarboxylase/phosphopantothenate--cysteine ligase CoaBC [Candidatus Gottesmanbacteria bacterium]
MKQTIVFGITGGIAACKMLDLIPKVKAKGINCVVVMTQAAGSIVPPEQFEKVSGNKVRTALFDATFDYREIIQKKSVDHINLAKAAHLMVIAPATANVLAKLAHGVADDYLTTTVLAATCPILIFPSMNTSMWMHPATQKNIAALRSFGYHVFDPDSGLLACGDVGQGRLPAPNVIESEILRFLSQARSLKNKRLVVTSGGTIESIDDVRVLTNRASGKMGAAIAEAAHVRGAEVLLVRSSSSVRPRYAIPECIVETAGDLEKILAKEVPSADILIHTAAVSDFTIKKVSGKLSSKSSHTVILKPNKKIVDSLKQINPNLLLVAFKAEPDCTDDELIAKAKQKLRESRADMVVANHIDRPNQGFGTDTNEVTIVTRDDRVTQIPLASKQVIAEKILDAITALE